jgi:transposase
MKNLTPAKIAKIKKLAKKGLSQREIAKKIKCSRSTVWYWLSK